MKTREEILKEWPKTPDFSEDWVTEANRPILYIEAIESQNTILRDLLLDVRDKVYEEEINRDRRLETLRTLPKVIGVT